MNNENFTVEDEANLRENLKKCSEETIEAVVAFRKTSDTTLIPQIIVGILDRFVEEEFKPLLANPSDDMVLAEALGLDSLTMVEIVLAVEEAIGTTIDNDEIEALKTLGDIKSFVEKKVSA
ncbi:MAG: phosphopantetheine-binding protein [Opitutales bacterium]